MQEKRRMVGGEETERKTVRKIKKKRKDKQIEMKKGGMKQNVFRKKETREGLPRRKKIRRWE